MRIVLLLAALGSSLLAQQPQSPLPATANPPSAVNPAALPAGSPSQLSPPGQQPSAAVPAPAQPASPAGASVMSPADAWLYSMQPFNNARSAPDDLTDADKWALSIGIARAKEQCDLRSKMQFDGEDLLAMGKLCIFGQDYEPARGYLIRYILQPQPKAPEVGRLLLARAFIGLGSIAPAESQLESLLSLFPYDASIHLGIDMVIDAAAASDSADDLAVIPRLEDQQIPPTLDALLNHGGSLSGNGDSVDAAMLVRDALRSADALRRNGKPDDAAKIVDQVRAAVTAPPIALSASFPAIQNALARYDLFHRPAPVRVFHGAEWTTAGANISRAVPLYDTNPAAHRIVTRISAKTTSIRTLDDRTLVLVFSLAGPASAGVIHSVVDRLARDRVTPGLKVIAVTSFTANAGSEVPTPQLLVALRGLRAELPAKLTTLVVPDSELKPFAIDLWPAGILLDGHGRVLWLDTVSGSDGSIRQMVRDVETPVLPFDLPPDSN